VIVISELGSVYISCTNVYGNKHYRLLGHILELLLICIFQWILLYLLKSFHAKAVAMATQTEIF